MWDIPKLKASDIEVRASRVTKTKNGVVGNYVLYKNARTDMNILDKIFGAENWKCSYEVIKNNLFCNIDIYDAEKKEWIRKQDVGVESNAEAQKGEASDAFKRAGVKVGIGRELYTSPKIDVWLQNDEYYLKDGKPKPTVIFDVSEIEYDVNNCISKLQIMDDKGKQRFYWTKGKVKTIDDAPNYPQPIEDDAPSAAELNALESFGEVVENPKTENVTANGLICAECGKYITPKVKSFSVSKFGKPLCYDCQKKQK